MDFQFDLQRFAGASYADLSEAEKRLLDRFRDFRIAFESISEDRYVRQESFAAMSTAVADLNDDVALISGNLNSEITQRAAQYTALDANLNSEVTLRAAQYTSLNSGLTNLANDVNGLSSALSMISGGFSGDLTQISTEIVSLQNDVETLNTALATKVETSDFNTALAGKVDTVSGKQLSTEDFTTAYKNQLDGLNTTLTQMNNDIVDLDEIILGKVDTVAGKDLSTNDFTNAYKNKLDGLSAYTFGEGFAMSGTTVNCTVQGAAVLDTVELTVEGGMWLVV